MSVDAVLECMASARRVFGPAKAWFWLRPLTVVRFTSLRDMSLRLNRQLMRDLRASRMLRIRTLAARALAYFVETDNSCSASSHELPVFHIHS